MSELNNEILQLREQTWQIARECLDSGETRMYRVLTDIAERLTNLINSSGKSKVNSMDAGKMIPIFALYDGQKYRAELDVSKIDGDWRPVFMEGKWWSVSGSAMYIKKNTMNPPSKSETNGWVFWKYADERSNKEKAIDRLRAK